MVLLRSKRTADTSAEIVQQGMARINEIATSIAGKADLIDNILMQHERRGGMQPDDMEVEVKMRWHQLQNVGYSRLLALNTMAPVVRDRVALGQEQAGTRAQEFEQQLRSQQPTAASAAIDSQLQQELRSISSMAIDPFRRTYRFLDRFSDKYLDSDIIGPLRKVQRLHIEVDRYLIKMQGAAGNNNAWVYWIGQHLSFARSVDQQEEHILRMAKRIDPAKVLDTVTELAGHIHMVTLLQNMRVNMAKPTNAPDMDDTLPDMHAATGTGPDANI